MSVCIYVRVCDTYALSAIVCECVWLRKTIHRRNHVESFIAPVGIYRTSPLCVCACNCLLSHRFLLLILFLADSQLRVCVWWLASPKIAIKSIIHLFGFELCLKDFSSPHHASAAPPQSERNIFTCIQLSSHKCDFVARRNSNNSNGERTESVLK